MPYLYNPHRLVNIWITDNPNKFLNFENQLRLIQKRVKNPKSVIYFIYDSRMLTHTSQQELSQFCLKHQIVPTDVRQLFPACKTIEEKKLIALYEDEIQHLDTGGNLGAASDFLRWLKPIYILGTYTDFDVLVNTKNLPETILVEKPILLSLGSLTCSPVVETLAINNHIIAIIDPDAALSKIKEIQQKIIFACEKTTEFFKEYKAKNLEQMTTFFGKNSAEMMLSADVNIGQFKLLDYKNHMTSLRMRNQILDNTKNNLSYCRFILEINKFPESESEEICQSKAASILEMTLWFSSLMGMLSEETRTLIHLATHNRDLFLQKMREKTHWSLIKTCVTHTSGPATILSTFEHTLLSPDNFNKLYSEFSFAHYGLEKSFISANSVYPHHNMEKYVSLTQGKAGDACDMSWLSIGQSAMREREQKMEHSALKIQSFFGEHKTTSCDIVISGNKRQCPAPQERMTKKR